MANVPLPKSYEQIHGDMLATYMSKIGVNDINVGSAVTSFFEAVSQAIYRASADHPQGSSGLQRGGARRLVPR